MFTIAGTKTFMDHNLTLLMASAFKVKDLSNQTDSRLNQIKAMLRSANIKNISTLGRMQLSGNCIPQPGLLVPKPDIYGKQVLFNSAYKKDPVTRNFVAIGGTARLLNMTIPNSWNSFAVPRPYFIFDPSKAVDVPMNQSVIVADTYELGDNTNIVIQYPNAHILIIANNVKVGTNVGFSWQRPLVHFSTDKIPQTSPPKAPDTSTTIDPPPPAQNGADGGNGGTYIDSEHIFDGPTVEIWTLTLSGHPSFDVRGKDGFDGQAGQDGQGGADGAPGRSEIWVAVPGSDYFPKSWSCKSGPGNGGDAGNGGRGGDGGDACNGGKGGAVLIYAPQETISPYAQSLDINDDCGVGGRGGAGGSGGKGGFGGVRGENPHACDPGDPRYPGKNGKAGGPGISGRDGMPGVKELHSGLFAITKEQFIAEFDQPHILSLQPNVANVGDQVILTGVNIQDSDSVLIDGVSCQVHVRSDSGNGNATITFTVPSVLGGNKGVSVLQKDGTESDPAQLYIKPALLSVSPAGKLKPSSTVTLTGSGFSRGMEVRVNGENQPVTTFINQTSVSFTLIRPRDIERNPNGEHATITVMSPGLLYESVGLSVVLDTFRMLVFGDSIQWGQGLEEKDKFHSLVLDEVKNRNSQIGVYCDVFAHSGAIIGLTPFDNSPLSALPGEVPTSYPTIFQQVSGFNDSPEEVHLILIDGGANDIDMKTLLNPMTSLDEITKKAKQHCGEDMKMLLKSMAVGDGKNPPRFPKAKIMVTGYYRILTEKSDRTLVDAFCMAIGLELGGILGAIEGDIVAEATFGSIVKNCTAFAETANMALAEAVFTTNSLIPGGSAVFFADPMFAPENAALAPNPFVYGINLSLSPEDPLAVAADRGAACVKAMDRTDLWTCKIASTGHPNSKGAFAYAEAIKKSL